MKEVVEEAFRIYNKREHSTTKKAPIVALETLKWSNQVFVKANQNQFEPKEVEEKEIDAEKTRRTLVQNLIKNGERMKRDYRRNKNKPESVPVLKIGTMVYKVVFKNERSSFNKLKKNIKQICVGTVAEINEEKELMLINWKGKTPFSAEKYFSFTEIMLKSRIYLF
jgi:hypothetical protein